MPDRPVMRVKPRLMLPVARSFEHASEASFAVCLPRCRCAGDCSYKERASDAERDAQRAPGSAY